jgi:hypothetical protein
MIFGGDPGSEMTDFTVANGLWVPVYNLAGPTLDLSTGACRVYSVASNGTTITQWYAGVRSKFALFPDTTGEIDFRFRISNFSYSSLASSSYGPFGVGCFFHSGVFSSLGNYAGGGYGLGVHATASTTQWVVPHMYMSATSGYTYIGLEPNTSPTLMGTSPGSGEIRITASPRFATAVRWPYVRCYYRAIDTDPWVEYTCNVASKFLSVGIWAYTTGLGIFIGAMGSRVGTIDTTIDRFVVDKGLMVIGQQIDGYPYD